MCKDIKTLDLAKKNITLSINCLRKYADLITSLENLKANFQNKNYKNSADNINSILELGNFFKPYAEIPQIQSTLRDRDKILNSIKLQLKDEFILFFKDLSSMTESKLYQGCLLTESIGKDFMKEIINIAVESVLTPYRQIYDQSSQKNIDNIEKRYIWFNKALKEFKKKAEEIFPHYWGVPCFIMNEFCGITSIQVTEVLQSLKQTDQEVVSLIRALQATIKFEGSCHEELKAEYEQYISLKSESENPFRITNIPNIKGSISKCFEEFTGQYIGKEEKDLRDSILKELQQDLDKKDKWADSQDELNLFNSSLVMFNKIKFLLDRASKISRGKTMVMVKSVVQKIITEYIDRVGQQVSKEESLLKKDEKSEQRFILNTCVLINTLDYVKETLKKMTDIFGGLIDEPFNQNINFHPEEEQSTQRISNCIDQLLNLFSRKLEHILVNSMLKKQWDKIENVILVSNYINDIKETIQLFCNKLKDSISKVYVLRCFRLVAEVTNTKFLETIYKIRKINEYSVQQLHIDFVEIKQQLNAIGKDQHGELISNLYPSLIEPYLDKSKNVIKLLGINNELIEESVKNFLPNISSLELSKILTLKNLKKSEINTISQRLNL
jgi:hypothetical protein